VLRPPAVGTLAQELAAYEFTHVNDQQLSDEHMSVYRGKSECRVSCVRVSCVRVSCVRVSCVRVSRVACRVCGVAI
jgi:hypothetical protein